MSRPEWREPPRARHARFQPVDGRAPSWWSIAFGVLLLIACAIFTAYCGSIR
jgi:hypothetical protein